MKRIAVLAAITCSLATVGGCASQGTSQPHTVTVTASSSPATATPTVGATAPNAVPLGKPGKPRGGVISSVKDADPSVVAAAAAETALRWDTALDTSGQDAQRRAARWMTPSYARQVQQVRVGTPGASWATLAAHHGWCSTSAHASSDPHPKDTATAASRAVMVQQSCHGVGGWQQPPTAWFVQEQLSRQGNGPWRVSLMVVQQQPGNGGAS